MDGGLEHALVGFRGPGEREFEGDAWAVDSGSEAGTDGGVEFREVGLGGVEEGHPEDVGVFAHDGAGVEVESSTVSDDDDGAAGRENLEVALEVEVCEHLEDEVGAPARGFGEDLSGGGGGGGISVGAREVGSFGTDEIEPFGCSGGADDAQAGGACDLDGGEPDAARCAVDENGLTRTCSGALEERPPGGAEGHADAGALRERDPLWEWEDAGRVGEELFGIGSRECSRVGAGGRARDIDALSGVERDAVAGGDDGSRGVVARREREFTRAVGSGADVGVHGVDAGGGDTNEDRPGCRGEVGHRLDPENLGPAESVNSDGVHGMRLSEKGCAGPGTAVGRACPVFRRGREPAGAGCAYYRRGPRAGLRLRPGEEGPIMDIRLVDGNIRTSEAMLGRVHERVETALDRFGDLVRGVEVRLSDANGPKGGADKRCVMHASMTAGDPIIVEHTDGEYYKAIDEASNKLKRAVTREADRRRSR